ncbi:MAG TPA: SRPBCC domain-containing protein [Candidatus Acidoferrales bacterium]|nr:SRPBCC domain-containing protein [Candidatus Acidoferrales bacterium]
MSSKAAAIAGATGRSIEDLTLEVNQEIHVRAPLDVTFAALVEQLGPEFDTPDGQPMPMKLELRPGGRWYRDLGEENGHCWGHIQAIKRPTLLEINGPMFMSYPVASNIQYRLSEVDGGTLIVFHHTALGLIQSNHREGVGKGWSHIQESVRKRAEGLAPGKTATR